MKQVIISGASTVQHPSNFRSGHKRKQQCFELILERTIQTGNIQIKQNKT